MNTGGGMNGGGREEVKKKEERRYPKEVRGNMKGLSFLFSCVSQHTQVLLVLLFFCPDTPSPTFLIIIWSCMQDPFIATCRPKTSGCTSQPRDARVCRRSTRYSQHASRSYFSHVRNKQTDRWHPKRRLLLLTPFAVTIVDYKAREPSFSFVSFTPSTGLIPPNPHHIILPAQQCQT